MRRIARVVVLAALLLLQSGAVDRAYSSPARTPNYPGVDVSNGCYMYTDGKIFCNDGGYALSNVVPQYVNQKVQIVLVVEVQGALQVCLAGSCVNASNSETITYPEFGETPYGAPDLLQVTCISGPVRWYISEINLIPISLPDTPTPTATVNPSSTATNTVVPGSTNTPIPTSTPRGYAATLTPSSTPTSGPTSTATAVPDGPIDCGDSSFPLLNCNFNQGTFSSPPTHWTYEAGGNPACEEHDSGLTAHPLVYGNYSTGPYGTSCLQTVAAGATGTVWLRYRYTNQSASGGFVGFGPAAGAQIFTAFDATSCPASGTSYCLMSPGAVVVGNNYTIDMSYSLSTYYSAYVVISQIWVQPSGTPTVPASATGTVTNTPVPGTPTDTPYPIPGASLTPYPTPTPCSGGACAVEDSTQIPSAIDTVVGIDTSPLTPLELLSVGRTSCQSFGAIPLVEPHLYGTPIYGSSNPISITWTVPATGTQFQPCADPNFSSAWWDTMWNLSILVAVVCWIGWLIHWVRSLFS